MGVDPKRVDELLTLVGLDKSAARKRMRQYSLGMRQRLGLAHALLGDPEVLILDEPANGLDPEGIRWMRRLLRDSPTAAGPSSVLAPALRGRDDRRPARVVIGDGRIVAGSREELLAGAGTLVRATDAEALAMALTVADLDAGAVEDGAFIVDANPEAVAALPSMAASCSSTSRPPRAPASNSCSSSSRSPPHESFIPPPDRRRAAQDGRHPRRLPAPADRRRAHAGRRRAGRIFAPTDEIVFRDFFALAITPASILVPIVGILLVSSEWSQPPH